MKSHLCFQPSRPSLSLVAIPLVRHSLIAGLVFLSALWACGAPSTTWTQLNPALSPPARSFAAVAYDEVSQKVILFGGFSGATYLNDTWSFDGTTWAKLNPPVAPPARSAAQMAYDRPTGKIVLFGGFDGVADIGDTWLWDGSAGSWVQANPARSPGNFTGPLLFTDLNGSVDEFGGYDGNFYQLTMWQWNGTDWIKLRPRDVPSARAFTTAATSLRDGQIVLFGGLADVNPVNTWTYDGTNWKLQSPTTQPPWVYSSSSAFDPRLNGTILFGGGSGGIDQDTTWGWTGDNWTQLFPAQSPPAREGAAMAYDQAARMMVLFGGQVNGSGGVTILGDTWQLNRGSR